jgi:PKHD-type hydroxylase
MNYYYFTDVFSKEELELIRTIGDKTPKQAATTVADENDVVSEYRKSEIAWLDDNQETRWLYEKIADLCKIANRNMWNFDIWGYQDSFQYTVYYGDGGHYDWHVDLGPGISNRKISFVLQLSDPGEYDGGDLQMNPGGQIMTVPKGLGTLCFFPSFMLHRVTPLNSGVRKSLVNWFCGANFR